MRAKEKAWWWKYRWLSWLYAHLLGYFWLPCPICGKHFGGHERVANQNHLMTSWHGGLSVCPDCSDEAGRRNKEYMTTHPVMVIDGKFTEIDAVPGLTASQREEVARFYRCNFEQHGAVGGETT